MVRKQSVGEDDKSDSSRYVNRRGYVKIGVLAAMTTGIAAVPTLASAQEWSYESAEGVHTELPYELVIEHVEPGARVEYEVEFDGEVEAGEWEHNATVESTVATGGLGPDRGLDNVYFDGEIVRFEVENVDHARYYIADAQQRAVIEEVNPHDFPHAPVESDDPDSGGDDAEEYQEFVVGETPAGDLEYDGAAEYVSDGYLRVFIEDGSTIENILFDFTEVEHAGIIIVTSDGQRTGPYRGATAWTVRNIGFRGMPNSNHSIYPIYVAVDDPDGTGIVENVFMDLRGTEPGGSGFQGSAISVFSRNRGTILNRNNFVAGPGGNGAYAEGNSSEGTIIWERCYYRDASSTLYRTGLGNSVVRDCIAVRNDPEGYRGRYFVGAEPSLGSGRAFWNRGGKDEGADPVIDNLQLYFNPDEPLTTNPIHANTQMGSPSRTVVRYATINAEWVAANGGDPVGALRYDSGGAETVVEAVDMQTPDITVLDDGVPYSPAMAASGQRGYPPNPFGPSPDGGVAGELPEQPGDDSSDEADDPVDNDHC